MWVVSVLERLIPPGRFCGRLSVVLTLLLFVPRKQISKTAEEKLGERVVAGTRPSLQAFFDLSSIWKFEEL